MTPAGETYDERIYRRGHPPHRALMGIALILICIVGVYFGWTKESPFAEKFEVRAMFDNAANIRSKSPVRIAGVDVGEVTDVRSVGDAAEVTFSVDDDGLPIHEDAQVEIRPRIFLEGNFFLDVRPGSPSAPDIEDGGTIPITQTATAVQLDQILTTLQRPDRENLQTLLKGYGTALNHQPTAADDRGQDPDVVGETAGEATNDALKYGGPAGRDSAIVNEALLGTEPGDLSALIAGQADIFDALLEREAQLQGLITNFNVFTGALASESDNLAETVRLLAPTLENATPALRNTNATFPYLRAFARDIRPGIAELPATIEASGPWLKQTRRLLGRNELLPISNELRKMAPSAGAAVTASPGLFAQTEALSRCVTDVLVPTGDVEITDAFATGDPNSHELMLGATSLAGSMQNFDGNGPYLRAQAGGGPVTVRSVQPNASFENEFNYAHTLAPGPIGTQPLMGLKPPLNTDVACHTQPVPDVNGPLGGVGPPSPAVP